MRSPARKIAVLAPDQESYPTVMGVVRYGREHGNWNVFVELDVDISTFRRLRSWDGHGVIAHLSTPEKAKAVRQLSVPVVNISCAIQRLTVPRVTTDQEAIGAAAARHLLERGFTRFAFLGVRGLWFSELRHRGFRECVRAAGFPCDAMDVGEEARSMLFWGRGTESVAEWLRTLTPPVGVMAVFDYLGAAVVQICSAIDLRVPYDVGVIGTDNDLTVCESPGVPLSSVSRDWFQQGYLAAKLLDRLMRGERPPKRETLIPPGPVVQRRSTDVLVTDCPVLAPGIRYIQEHLAEPFGTKALVRELGMSRRWLYTQFAKSFGCTPGDYIMRLRVDRAKQMLSRPDPVPLREIVEACGFSSERHLRAAMVRFCGMPPSRYRQTYKESRTNA
ncbi:MAG: substrate-binding domain-containing protein [Planctomycetota bacterium]